jgi:hypothetical protein
VKRLNWCTREVLQGIVVDRNVPLAEPFENQRESSRVVLPFMTVEVAKDMRFYWIVRAGVLNASGNSACNPASRNA